MDNRDILGNTWVFKLYFSWPRGPGWCHVIVWTSPWNPNHWASWSPSLAVVHNKEINSFELTFHSLCFSPSCMATDVQKLAWPLEDLHSSVSQCGILTTCQSDSWSVFKMCVNRDFPGGSVVKNPPSNAGDTGSIPGRGTKIPHAVGQLSLHAATTEPVAAAREKPMHCNKEPVHRNERSRMPQRRSHMPQLRTYAAKWINKKINIKKKCVKKAAPPWSR